MNEKIIDKLNAVLNDWKNQYDILSAVQAEFREGPSGYLFLNEMSLYPLDDLSLTSATLDPEHIMFYFNNNRRIFISFDWPENRVPYIYSVHLGYWSVPRS